MFYFEQLPILKRDFCFGFYIREGLTRIEAEPTLIV